MTQLEISETLRRRIVADLHLGRLKPGGRLPSLRTVARELGVSVRAAARAYTELQREGLVQVRGRSGIYLLLPPTMDLRLESPLDWYAEMFADAWQRRLTVTEVNRMLQDIVSNPLHVACVESTEDHMVAFCAELEEDFALKTQSIKLSEEGATMNGDVVTLYDALATVDFVVTTAFHATEVRVAADLLKKPVVVASLSDTLVSTIEQQLSSGPVTIVALDPLFADRLRTHLVERFETSGELRVALVDDVLKDPGLTQGTTPLYTRAARRRLNEDEYHLLPPPVSFLSAAAARKVVQCMLATQGNRELEAA